MTWQDRQRWGIRLEDRKDYRRASFRGAEFWVDLYELDQGRRLAIQRFPGKQYTNVQDLGRDSDRISVTAILVGDDYDQDRDALEAALLEGGEGKLVLPWRDPVRVTVVGRVKTQENKSHRGFCTIKFTCIETTEAPNYVVSKPLPQVRVAGVVLRERSTKRFRDKFEKVKLLSTEQKQKIADGVLHGQALMDEVQQGLSSKVGLLSKYANGVSHLFGTINSLINLPLEFSDAIVDAVITVYSSIKSSGALAQEVVETWGRGGPVRYLADTTFGFANDFTATDFQAANDAERDAQIASDALHRFILLQMLLEFAMTLTYVEFESYEQAVDVLDQWGDAIDVVLQDASDPEYLEISDLSTALGQYVRAQLNGLPSMSHYTPAQTMPMLLIAHIVYGDASRGVEIAERNRVRNPGFVQGGIPLEILNDV